jgi:hypothetical protein
MAFVFLMADGTNDGETSSFIFDALTETSEKYAQSVTKHPVESGYNVSDHKFQKNPVFSLVGVVQNNPLSNTSGNTSSNNVVTQGGDDRISQARTQLLDMYNSDDTFTLVMKYESFEDCVITSLDFPRKANTANILTARITVEQLRVVTSETVTITAADSSISDDVSSTVSTGSGGKEEVDTDSYQSKAVAAITEWAE